MYSRSVFDPHVNVTHRQRQPLDGHSPFSRHGLDSSFSHSRNLSFNQSGMLGETSRHTLKSFSPFLPIIVVEAISSETAHNISVKLTDFGWAWLVCGRKLFIWKYKQFQQNRTSTSSCYELLLPPSDLAHKANLVCVFDKIDEDSHSIPSAIAVSPEGIIRYWPNIAYDGHSIETSITDLQGQECMMLVDIDILGCIIGTTTNTLVHVVIDNIDNNVGQNSINFRTIKAPQGVLAGFSKKVTSFIFGSVPASNYSETKQLIKIIADTTYNGHNDDDEFEPNHYIWVLAENSVQKWQIIDEFSEKLIDEFDVERSVRSAFLDKVWNRETTHPNQLQIWSIDISLLNPNEIVLLVAGLNADVSNQLFYAIAILTDNPISSPSSSHIVFKSFFVLRNHTVCYSEQDQEQLLALHLLTGTINKQAVYIYNYNRVLAVYLGSEDVDVIDINGSENGILGAGVCDGFPLLFTRKNAIISIVPNSRDIKDSMTVVEIDDEIVDNEQSITEALKKSFVLYLKEDNARCEKLVGTILQLTDTLADNKLDNCVIRLSSELCDEIPKSDPRWAESMSLSENTAITSAIIATQLEEKFKIHKLLIEFLKSLSIWQRLTTCIIRNGKIVTHLELSEHAEKLIAAIKLKKLHEENQILIDEVIKIVLEKRQCSVPSRLTDQDLFYREITKIEDFFDGLLIYEQSQINDSLINPKKILTMVINVSQILIEVFQEVCSYRKTQGIVYESLQRFKCEYIPWNWSAGSSGIRNDLLKHFDYLVSFGIESINVAYAIEDDTQLKGIIYQSVLELSDIILDGFVCQLKSIEISSERYSIIERNYETTRTKCIKPLIKARQYDRATILAEKYQDFDVLIRICDDLDNHERLHRYMTEFSNQGFPQYMFNWYMKQGKLAKIMINTSNSPMLTDFLKNHQQINWLHELHLGQFEEASKTLKSIGLKEQQNIARRKTLLSLSKLSAMAANKNANFNHINQELNQIIEKETNSQAMQTN